ncbi:hypothetical protein BHM03_00027338 [Ensete ventricosum]|nr:hypothetical protein BHM03_00027338 [Ensete ventricosum]
MEEDVLRCCGSKRFAKEMVSASPFTDLDHALRSARDIWEKFGFVFIICASGRGTPEILAELKKRYLNRPIVELEMGAQEEMKIIELRLARLFNSDAGSNIPVTTGNSHSTRPPITTHVLDVACGSPASGMEVHLEMWKGTQQHPSFTNRESTDWMLIGSSITNTDGRSGPLMGIAKHITPGFYRISFNTGKYAPSGFFPYVSLVFQVRENQIAEHFHVPLLYSPFSFTTYRGS